MVDQPTPTQKGNIAEAAIAFHAVRCGIDVYRPITEGGCYDLVFGFADGHWRGSSASGAG